MQRCHPGRVLDLLSSHQAVGLLDPPSALVSAEKLTQAATSRCGEQPHVHRVQLRDSLYHPPYITIDPDKSSEGTLYLIHQFEEKPLVQEFLANTMMGIEYLWGGQVKLETSEVTSSSSSGKSQSFSFFPWIQSEKDPEETEIKWQRVVYTMQQRKLTRKIL